MFKSLLKHFQAPLVLPPYPSHMSGPDYLLSLIFCPLQHCSLSSSHISLFQPLARTILPLSLPVVFSLSVSLPQPGAWVHLPDLEHALPSSSLFGDLLPIPQVSPCPTLTKLGTSPLRYSYSVVTQLTLMSLMNYSHLPCGLYFSLDYNLLEGRDYVLLFTATLGPAHCRRS